MDYKYGEKIEVKNANLDIEVCGVLPASQPLVLNWSGEKVYNITINGKHIHIKESVLAMLIESQEKIDKNSIEKKKK